MRKGQIKLLEKAEKEGFTEEQLAVLRGNQMLCTLDYYYFLLKRGVSASVINAIIKAGEGWGSHIIQFQPIELFLIHHRSSSQKLLQSFKGMTIYAFNKVSTNSQTDGGRHCPCEADPTDV